MTDVKYDYCTSVAIGYDVTHKTTITNILYYADRIVVVEGEGEVEPIPVINTVHPAGVSGRHKYWEITVALDSNDMEAIYTQQVETGEAASRAIMESADNHPIGYFVVTLKKLGVGSDTITFESGHVYCIDEEEDWNFEEGVPFKPTLLTFMCIGTRT